MAETSIIDLTEDSYTEEYVSTGDDLRFEAPSGQSGSSIADQSVIFVGESVRGPDLRAEVRAPLRSLQRPFPVQTSFGRPPTGQQNKKPSTKAKVVEKRVETPPPAPVIDEPTCPICMCTFTEIKSAKQNLMSTRCGHIFCSTCLEKVKKLGRTQAGTRIDFVECPTCRKQMHWQACHPIYL